LTPTNDPDLSLPGVPLRDIEQRWGLSRNGLKARAKALGVELERVSSTVTLWPGEYVELGDQLDAHIKAGKPMATFPGLAPAGSAITKTAPTKPAAPSLVDAAAADALRAFYGLPAAGADPLKRARGLAEAADNGLVLTSDELAALGVKGIDGFADRDLAFGFAFHKHQQRNRVLWTVERAISKPAVSGGVTALTPAKTEKQVGFGLGAVMLPCDGARIFATNTLR
jgi:hypothetical protein